jgi:hypothetical protein
VGVDHEVSMIFSSASAKDDESWPNTRTDSAIEKKKKKRKNRRDPMGFESYSNDEEWSDAESRS